ncbi:hypothetical protein ACIOJD_06545 [Streptomyces sp. NPDC088116]|uniref:hypothetical protein n=1 Tax=Streptomyces sp. NPDC088116 TaxID=3365825 RepID=UPI003801590F
MSGESSPAALAQQLTQAGHLTPAWREAFVRVDRRRFIPDRIWIRGEGGYFMATVQDHDRHRATTTRTGLDPRRVFGNEDAAFTAGVLVPDCRYGVGHGPDGEFTLWLADHTSGAWACVDYVPGATEFRLRQHGPRRLWAEVEAAYAWWEDAGSPERTRYGLTVTPAGQHLWLDAPGHLVPKRSPGAATKSVAAPGDSAT